MFHVSRLGLAKSSESYHGMANGWFRVSHLQYDARPEFFVEVGGECRAGAMVVEVQIACAISKAAEGRNGVLWIGGSSMSPDMDLEVRVVCCVTIAFAASTHTPDSISSRNDPREQRANAYLRHSGFFSSHLTRRTLESMCQPFVTCKCVRCVLARLAACLHFWSPSAGLERRLARRRHPECRPEMAVRVRRDCMMETREYSRIGYATKVRVWRTGDGQS